MLWIVAMAQAAPRAAADVEPVMTAAAPGFSACHDPSAPGELEAKFTVSPEGAVANVKVTGPETPAACLSDRLAALSFPAAPETTLTTLAYKVTLSATGAGLRPQVVLGALDKAVIDAEIKDNMGDVRRCYLRALNKSPGLAGKVTVKFVIAADGTVSSATTKTTTMNADTGLEACINETFRAFRFPEPKGGGIVIVSYPFVFSP